MTVSNVGHVRRSRQKRTAANPLFIGVTTFAAMFDVSVNVALGWERAGLITAVKLPAKDGSKRPPKRFFIEDVQALARRFRSGDFQNNQERAS